MLFIFFGLLAFSSMIGAATCPTGCAKAFNHYAPALGAFGRLLPTTRLECATGNMAGHPPAEMI